MSLSLAISLSSLDTIAGTVSDTDILTNMQDFGFDAYNFNNQVK